MAIVIGNIIWNILTSGKPTESDKKDLSDYIIDYVLLNFILIFGFIFLICYIVVNYRKGAYMDAGICGGMATLSVLGFITARTGVDRNVPVSVLASAYIIFCTLLIWNGNAQGMNFLFIYLFPPLVLMQTGMKRGIVYSIIFFVIVCIEIFIPNISKFAYNGETASRIVVAYILILGITITVEATRAAKDRANLELTAKLREESQRAEAATIAKSNFLANTSHEIRTPMNAILGMVELILRRRTISPETYTDALAIKQAGESLLSIINDILDFSKIESGKMEIIPGEYSFETLINEVINIIQLRIGDKHIRFITNVDGSIPVKLYGDMIRIRQILLNILSNAVKYTEKGYIKLAVFPKINGEDVLLTFAVSDTGMGIKEEDMDKLFGDFNRFDSHRNRGIEGTGLGLAISRNLCQLMDGDISVESKYGKGSVFTVQIPQKARDTKPLAYLENTESKTVLLYERRNACRDSLAYSLTNLGVPFTVTNSKDLFEKLEKENWPFVFVSPDIAEQVLAFLKGRNQKTVMVLLSKLEDEELFQQIPMISVPSYTASIANTLNGVKENIIREKPIPWFTAPTVKILIVDDISTNLIVARGLLEPYGLNISTCTSGKEAIELIQKNRYDLIFMDHMMPEMDGIEAVAVIRSLEDEYFHSLPIIALTANAVTGMREMFMQKGFNDYISKPIEMYKLDRIIDKWIPEEKKIISKVLKTSCGNFREKKSIVDFYPLLVNTGVDVQRGLILTGGSEEGYRKVLASFCKDAKERLLLLDRVPSEQDLPLFNIGVHALKSAAAAIGAAAISREAAKLEAAGKTGDLKAIEQDLPHFHRNLKSLTEQIGLTLNAAVRTETETEKTEEPLSRYLLLLRELKTALEHKNIESIDHILAELESKPLGERAGKIIAEISDAVLMTEFEASIEKTVTLLSIAGS